MRRFNVFQLVHKGLRAMMYDVSLKLQHTDFAHADGFPESLGKLSELLDIFDKHAGHEDTYIFCLLEQYEPGLLKEMEDEHVKDHTLTAQLRKLIEEYSATYGTLEKAGMGNQVCHAFNEFIAFNLTHLNKEETVVNEVLWMNYTDLDIIKANQRLVSSLSPDEARYNAAWMIRSCNNSEIIAWINSIKKDIPPHLMQLLMQLAEQELPVHRFEVIQNGIISGI